MDIETVVQDLERRFAQPLPEYYDRRIIFWHDEDREFEDKLEDLSLSRAKLVVLTGRNNFAVKKLLTHDDTTGNYLVYDPRSFEDQEDDWLLDIELYSESFRADLISIWMEELGLEPTLALRREMKRYRKYLNAKDRRARLAAQRKPITTPAELHKAVMAALCGLRTREPGDIIRSVLSAGLDRERNAVYQDLVTYGAEEIFWSMVGQGTGCGERDLGHLAAHILLTAATRTMRPESLGGLERFLSPSHQAYCYDFVSGWLRGGGDQALYEIARCVEDELCLPQRFSQLPLAELVETECFPCINEVILTGLMTDINAQVIDTEAITMAVERRRTCAWYGAVRHFYEGILQVANMQSFFRDHAAGFHLASASGIWNAYTEDYYRMDTFYRQFHLCFQHSLECSHLRLDDLFKQVADQVEGLYHHWFLGELGRNWSDICAEELKEQGEIIGIPTQESFYRRVVRASESRIFVIISDALRYEVAAELAEQLRVETQSKVKLNHTQGIFPSVTKFGMAALLPHTELTAEVKNGQLTVLADGRSTASGNRDAVLKAEDRASVALQYQNIIGMKRAERSALVKGMDVVYIYHDTIDEASHHSDSAVFPACEKAISELKNLVRIIVNEFGGTHIAITSDHGFLYTYSPLEEREKADRDSFAGRTVEVGRRYAIVEQDAEPEYLMPVKLLHGRTAYRGYTPRENVRIKLSGSGLNFVHGGVSLQELVVPEIDYHYLRNDNREYRRNRQKYDTKPVGLELVSVVRKISNMIFNLKFYQTEAVGGNREAATYQVWFTDADGMRVSDVQKIIADKTNQDAPERTFKCTFNLKQLKYRNTDPYYLVIEDEQGLQLPRREEFQIDIAFAVDDFEFFS